MQTYVGRQDEDESDDYDEEEENRRLEEEEEAARRVIYIKSAHNTYLAADPQGSVYTAAQRGTLVNDLNAEIDESG